MNLVHRTDYPDPWQLEIFLPSYADYEFDDLETRKDPVQEIILTDEEAEKMVPS